MITLIFSEQEITLLHHERFHHPHPRVRIKMEALWLKSRGLSHHEITRLTGISANTLRKYLRQFSEGGVERLRQLAYHRPQSELLFHRDALRAYFREHPPSTIREAMVKIQELTGIMRRPTQVRHFLRSMGLKTLRGQHRLYQGISGPTISAS